jgi:uncharacterized protein YqkB
MSIGGTKKEVKEIEDNKYVGIFTACVVAINPTIEQFKSLLDIELKEDSKATDYLSENKDGNTTLRVDVWLEDVTTSENEKPRRIKKSFFLEDRERENKDGSKKQYINNIGICTWAEDESQFPNWFANRDYRQAYVGEEKLYGFIRTWLGALDYKDVDTVLSLDWKKLMKGNVKDLKDQLDGEYCTNVLALATIKTVEKTNTETSKVEIKEYQSIYDEFLPAYYLKNFKTIDYNNSRTLDLLKSKASKELKPVERWVLNLTGEYGSKEYFSLKELHIYNPGDNLVSSNEPLSEEDSDY